MEDPLVKLANASGFLFQIRVDHEIARVSASKGGNWEVIAREHRWLDPVSGSEAFVDLILQSGAVRMIVECKRTTDATWLFLIPDDTMQMQRAKLLWTYRQGDNSPLSAWDDFNVVPLSPESAFCVVRGQGEGDTPMLERLAGGLLRATEVVANEELAIASERTYGGALIYFPAIVTNADLRVCRFSPGDVDLASGKLDKAHTQPVPLVRFRKSLSTTHSLRPGVSDLQRASQENERTVLVMNVAALETTLPKTELRTPSMWDGGQWPWQIAIQRSQR